MSKQSLLIVISLLVFIGCLLIAYGFDSSRKIINAQLEQSKFRQEVGQLEMEYLALAKTLNFEASELTEQINSYQQDSKVGVSDQQGFEKLTIKINQELMKLDATNPIVRQMIDQLAGKLNRRNVLLSKAAPIEEALASYQQGLGAKLAKIFL